MAPPGVQKSLLFVLLEASLCSFSISATCVTDSGSIWLQ